MLVKILIGLAVVIVLFLAYAAMQPDEFRISRSVTMNAPTDRIFEYMNNPKKSEAWSPWLKMDPDAKTSTEGPEAGVGAVYKWNGEKIGSGVLTITESQPAQLVRMKLDFLKPMESTSTAEYTLTPEGNQTVVTWSMYGKNNFIGKVMGVLMNCEKMMNETFTTGLENLRAIVEK